MDKIYMQTIKEYADNNNIHIIMEFDFQTCQWLFRFYKNCIDGIKSCEFTVPESYLTNTFEQKREFSLLSMLAEAEEKFKDMKEEIPND